ncbi:MAG: NAD(P)/FAD-dependent oxidoreductase [Dehalococcoidia bacterium]|jgi:phytoene dehydrogenase-like protein
MAGTKFDAIVIGAGPGGSACAALLQKRGLKTLLVEKNDRVGGKALNYSKDGFTYELWPVMGLPRYNTMFEKVLNEVGAQAPMSDVFPTTGSLAAIMSGKATPKDGGFLYKPAGSDKYESYILVPPMQIPERLMNDPEGLANVNRMFEEMSTMTPEQLSALDDVTFHDFVMQYNIPQGAYSYLAVLCNILFVVQIDLCSASEMIKTLRQFTTGLGSAYFMGGYAKLSEALVGAFQQLGGQLNLNTRVEKISVENGQVTGIVTDKGTFSAPIVVSNAGIQPTVLKLVGEEYFDKSYANRIRGLVPSLALIGHRYFLDEIVFEDCAYIIYSDNNWWNMERYMKAKEGNIPEDMMMIFFNPQGFDPAVAPEGKQLLLTGTLAPADPKLKNQKAWLDAFEDKIEQFRPGFRKHIIKREDYTTTDVSRVTRDSAVPGCGGECIGLGQIVGQCGKNKPSPIAPIQGLFYVGVDAGGDGVGTHHAVTSAYNVAPLVIRYSQTH